MIPIRCFTNIDKYKRLEWPDKLPCRPMVGDFMWSKDGLVRLKVVGVTFETLKPKKSMNINWKSEFEVVLEVELHTWNGQVPL